jgi:uncharacterized protein
MGAIYADRLAKRGYDLILVARNKNRLTGLAERLKDETGRSHYGWINICGYDY